MSEYSLGREKANEMVVSCAPEQLEQKLRAYLTEPRAPVFLKGMEDVFAEKAYLTVAALVAEAAGDKKGAEIYRHAHEHGFE